MSSGIHSFKQTLFLNATGAQFSPEFAWQGGVLELISTGTTFGGQGIGLQIRAPDGVWVDGSDFFLKSNGTVSGTLCPGMIRGSLGLGANTVSAWVIGVPA